MNIIYRFTVEIEREVIKELRVRKNIRYLYAKKQIFNYKFF